VTWEKKKNVSDKKATAKPRRWKEEKGEDPRKGKGGRLEV